MVRLLVFIVMALLASAQERYAAVADQPVAGLPYTRYFTQDAYDRRITFYISRQTAFPAPLVVFVLGSGAHSHFSQRGAAVADAHRALREVIKDHAALLVVEKPGVAFLSQPGQPGTAEGATEEFRRENTLDRWAEAVNAAIRAARTLPLIDSGRLLLMGHSEGARIASRVAALNNTVSHVALLSGGGAPHLFSLMTLARAGALYGDASTDAEQRVRMVLDGWAQVHADPESVSRMFLGHPHLYWTTYGKSNSADELLRSRARIYIAQGTEDRSTPVIAFDILHARLLVEGADVTADRVRGADHAFHFPPQFARDGQRELFTRVLAWFLSR